MGHHLDAFLLRGPFDDQTAAELDLHYVRLDFDITMFFIDDVYCDYWEHELGVYGTRSTGVLHDAEVVHPMLGRIAPGALYAAISTDDFAGIGNQAAASYRGGQLVFDASSETAPINVVLDRYRDSSDYIPDAYLSE